MEIELPKLVDPNLLLSSAVQNYVNTKEEQYIQVWINEQKEQDYLASYFLRTVKNMPELEQIALSLCEGTILDIGAGAGAHCRYLCATKVQVTALESNDGFCKLLSGIKELTVIQEDFFSWTPNRTYDTILLLMNGLGIAQKLDRLSTMLHKLKHLLAKNGKILIEITEYKHSPEYDRTMNNPEAIFRLLYNNQFSSKFYWLYPNLEVLETHCNAQKLHIKLLYQEDEALLVELTK